MATARRLGLLAGISCVLSVSIHALRLRLTESKQHTEHLLHQAESINAAARRLSSLLEPSAIAALGAELAAQAASRSRLSRRRVPLPPDRTRHSHGGGPLRTGSAGRTRGSWTSAHCSPTSSASSGRRQRRSGPRC